MLYLSHAINEILYLTSHLAVMEHGQILGQGAFADVIRQDRTLHLARSLGLENVLRATVLRHEPEAGVRRQDKLPPWRHEELPPPEPKGE